LYVDIWTQPFTAEEKLELAIETVGKSNWEELDQSARDQFIAMEVWHGEGYEKFKALQYGDATPEEVLAVDEGKAAKSAKALKKKAKLTKSVAQIYGEKEE
jgi:hypothetical protein